MAGISVDRPTIDNRIGMAILALRAAFESVQHINQYLVNNPVPASPGVDPLIATFNYTSDEAYAIRLVFQTFAQDYTNQASTFATASKLTGLQ